MDEIVPEILRQDQSTPDIWLAALEDSAGARRARRRIALSFNRRARSHEEVRADLRNSNAVPVIINLLRDKRPDEFEQLLLRFLRVRPKEAIRFIAETDWPPRAPFPKKLIQHLLSSNEKSARLAGITLLGALNATHIPTGPEALTETTDNPKLLARRFRR